jgi:ribosomal protein S19
MSVIFNMGIDWVGVAQIIVGICSLIIAGFAIWYTRRSIKQQETHHLKSVKPIAILRTTNLNNRITLCLENRGVGPLMINKVVYIFNGKNYRNFDELLHEEKIDTSDMFSTHLNDAVILPNNGERIMDYIIPLTSKKYPRKINTIREVISKSKIDITFSDIYGTEFHTKKSLGV